MKYGRKKDADTTSDVKIGSYDGVELYNTYTYIYIYIYTISLTKYTFKR